MRFERIDWVSETEAIITASRMTWFGLGPTRKIRARGSGTGWRSFPNGNRLGTNAEAVFSHWWIAAKWRKAQ